MAVGSMEPITKPRAPFRDYSLTLALERPEVVADRLVEPPARVRQLSGVDCPRPNHCMAVGSVLPSTGPRRPIGERWNGSQWVPPNRGL